MLANMEVVRCVEEVGEEELRAFLRGVRVFGFHSAACGTVDRHLLGLSSYDGQRAYVAAWLDLEEARRTLEHELVHDLSRWRRRPCEPRLISPLRNPRLRSMQGGHLIEGGDFYEERV